MIAGTETKAGRSEWKLRNVVGLMNPAVTVNGERREFESVSKTGMIAPSNGDDQSEVNVRILQSGENGIRNVSEMFAGVPKGAHSNTSKK